MELSGQGRPSRPLLPSAGRTVAAMALVLGTLWWVAPTSQGADASLEFISGTGAALFTPDTPLVVGETLESCVLVGATGALPGDEVFIGATEVAGALAADLEVVVQAGTGGGGGSCAGFTGSTVYTGTLADLGAETTSTDGVASGWEPEAEATRSFRFAVTVQDGAPMDADADARFVWNLVASDDPPPVTPTPTPTVTVTPTPTPSVTPTPTPSVTPTPTPTPSTTTTTTTTVPPTTTTTTTTRPTTTTTRPTTTTTRPTTTTTTEPPVETPMPSFPTVHPEPTTEPIRPTPARPNPTLQPTPSDTTTTTTPSGPAGAGTSTPPGGAGNGGNGGGPRGGANGGKPTPDVVIKKPGIRGSVDHAVEKTVTQLLGSVMDEETAIAAGRTVAAVVTRPEYPVVTIAAALAFLILQSRVDRRDPKLAFAARSSRDNEENFPDLFPPTPLYTPNEAF